MPGQPGTKKLVEQYGEDLVCVRYYRYDPEQEIAVKTIEVIVARNPWRKSKRGIPGNTVVSVRVELAEAQLQKMVKAAGGKWNRERRLWELPYKEASALGLTDRIVPESGD